MQVPSLSSSGSGEQTFEQLLGSAGTPLCSSDSQCQRFSSRRSPLGPGRVQSVAASDRLSRPLPVTSQAAGTGTVGRPRVMYNNDSPTHRRRQSAVLLSVEEQVRLHPHLHTALRWGCRQRRAWSLAVDSDGAETGRENPVT